MVSNIHKLLDVPEPNEIKPKVTNGRLLQKVDTCLSYILTPGDNILNDQLTLPVYPSVIIPNYFKGKEVILTDPDMLFKKESLDYNAVNKNPSLSKGEKQERRKKIIESAHLFYRANNPHCSDAGDSFNSAKNRVSTSAVAEYFGIPKQSFYDHINATHVNSTVSGSSSKSLVSNEEVKMLNNLIYLLNIKQDSQQSDKSCFLSNKQLQDLINIVHIKSIISDKEINILKKRIEILKIQHTPGTDIQNKGRLIILQLLLVILDEDLSKDQLKVRYPILELFELDKFPDLITELTILKDPENEECTKSLLKTFSKSTLNRLRKRLGTSSSQRKRELDGQLKSNDITFGNILNHKTFESHNISPGIGSESEDQTKNRDETPIIKDINQMLSEMRAQFNLLNRGNMFGQKVVKERTDSLLKEMATIITDKEIGTDTISKINNYWKCRNKLLEMYEDIGGNETNNLLLVKHISLLADLILKLVFENVRLKKTQERLTQLFHSVLQQRQSSPPTLTMSQEYSNEMIQIHQDISSLLNSLGSVEQIEDQPVNNQNKCLNKKQKL